ncbi:MAG: sensor histidine kinase [Thermoanaerobaculales bacterium]
MVARRPPPAPDEASLRRELDHRTREVELLRSQLAEVEAARSQFLAAAEHELKTPLTIIESYLEIVLTDLTDGLSEEQLSFLQIVFDSVMRLRGLILDLVDLAALESGSFHLDLAPIAVDTVVKGFVEATRAEAERAGLTLTADLAPDLPDIRADSERLAEILERLLDNALQFTHAGGTISIRGRCTGTEVLIQVVDDGVGIPRDRIEGIFEEFVQVHRRPGEQRQGSGLGLAICRRIAQAMGAKLEAESIHGEGSTFTIRLSLA